MALVIGSQSPRAIWGGTGILAGIVIVFSLTVGETFLSTGNISNIARQISIDAPVVFGQAIVLIAGGIDISVGSNMAMAGAINMGLQPSFQAGKQGRGWQQFHL